MAAFELPHYLFCDPLVVVVAAAAAIIALGLLQSTERGLSFHLSGNLQSSKLLSRQRSEVHEESGDHLPGGHGVFRPTRHSSVAAMQRSVFTQELS